jgi:tetratricopeptide (TPR) repeat protein
MTEDTSAKRRRKRTTILWELLAGTVVSMILFHIAMRPAISVRSPLKILTPPFTADKSEIIQELRDRKFQALDAQLNSYQKGFEENVLEEGNLSIAFDAFSFTDTSLSPILDEWVKSEPASYPAHLARAKYLLALGLQARGSGNGAELSAQQISEMRRLYSESVKEAVAAIQSNPKASIAYAAIIEAAKGVSDYKTLQGAYAASFKSVPLSLSTRVAVITALRPRWGGSHEAMAKFAEEAQKYAAQNPRLKSLKGFADQDKGDMAWDAGNLKQAVRYYNQALEEGGDFALAYAQRGSVYDVLRRYDDALEDLSRANRLRPQDTFTLQALAYLYVHLNRPKDALAVIQEYQQFAELPSDLVSLEQWAQNFDAGAGQPVKIGGN